MKIRQALIIAAAAIAVCAVVAQAKPHESKKSHPVKHSREHELTNRMGHGDHHRRDHGGSASSSSGSGHKEGGATQKPTHDKVSEHSSHSHNHKASAPVGHELKKDLHLHHITEHNIEKKKDDDKTDTGVLMESEHLIHVTPRPAKVHRAKGNHHKTKANNQTTQTPTNKGSSPSTRKIQKTPKKYSAKKHGWKKTPRKEKTAKERLREKYERREKRAKALHHAIAGKKN